jgi:short-subunit dehydrogenase
MDKTGSTALITGASSGIGAAYAERLARRGYDLVLVARNHRRRDRLATHIRAQSSVEVEVIPADLTTVYGLSEIEARLRNDERIDLLGNNAGAIGLDALENPDLDEVYRIIRLNVTAVARLPGAVIPRFSAGSNKAIINVASAVALIPEVRLGIYGATKA